MHFRCWNSGRADRRSWRRRHDYRVLGHSKDICRGDSRDYTDRRLDAYGLRWRRHSEYSAFGTHVLLLSPHLLQKEEKGQNKGKVSNQFTLFSDFSFNLDLKKLRNSWRNPMLRQILSPMNLIPKKKTVTTLKKNRKKSQIQKKNHNGKAFLRKSSRAKVRQ